MIEAKGLHKSFRIPRPASGRWGRFKSLFDPGTAREAVRDISFTIEQGEFVGYIGPNGAGKSTTIKMLTGILHPTSGDVRIDGLSPHRQRRQVATRIGVVFGQRTQLWWDLPVRDSFDILAAMYKLGDKRAKQTLDRLDALLQLGAFLDTPVRKLSLGQRMRADLAAALLHDPDVLFLDEPTIGLDVNAKRSIRKLLAAVNRELGKTVLLTTHDMDDIEQLCTRVLVINEGTLAYDGTIDALRRKIGLPTVMRVSFRTLLPNPLPEVETSAHYALADVTEDTVTVTFNRDLVPAMDVLRQLEALGDIGDVHMEEPAFEEVIRTVY